MRKRNMKIFAGLSNPKLAKKVASLVGIKLGKIELSRFANGESRVYVKERVVNEKAVVLQSFSYPPDEHLVEFCLIVDALKRLGAKKIIAVIPWLGYCIQDKVFRLGEPLSSKVIANILQALKVDKIITLDIHNETVAGFFDLDFIHLSALSVFVDYFKKSRLRIEAIISPDIGGLKRSTTFAQEINLPLLAINKKRDLVTGKVSILGLEGKVKEQAVLIVDDFISTGGTLIKVARFLKEKGAKKVYAAATHHFYIKGVQKKIDKSPLDGLFVTDTIMPQSEVKSSKLKIISVSGLIAKELKNC